MKIAIYSDVICPWCYVGKRRLERALAEEGREAQIEWLPFELNPDMPREGMMRAEYRARKFGARRADELDRDMTALGASEGIAFAFDRMARTPNTRRAHMLIARANAAGLGGAAAAALFRAYFEKAEDIGDPQVLVRIGTEIGLSAADAEAALADPELERFVVETEREAAGFGISGVPFFVIDEAWAVSGAQPTPAWVETLRKLPQPAA